MLPSRLSAPDMRDEQIYTSGDYNYLFVAGNYRYIDVYANSLAGVSAWIYATTSLIDENNPSLPIVFKK